MNSDNHDIAEKLLIVAIHISMTVAIYIYSIIILHLSNLPGFNEATHI